LSPSSGITRREFLRITGAGLAGASLPWLAGCGEGSGSSGASAGGGEWKQFSGTTINFISENTAPTSAIAANLTPFTNLTGIQVKIQQLELTSLAQRVALDFGSHSGEYHVIYADPYQVLAPLHGGFTDLRKFMDDSSLPSVPGGTGDFIPTQLEAAGHFGDKLFALPYDAPTMIWCYRKDLFEKYRDRMKQDLGFDPTPSENSTWEQYYRIAKWFNDNQDDVPYGAGHQARQHDALMCDFSNVLWAYGGDYFDKGQAVGKLGTTDPGPSALDSPEAIQAAKFYNKLIGIAHPGSTSWDWNDLGEAFGDEQFAMCPEWHEFAAAWEVGALKGNIGYTTLPKGPARSANHYGGTGIAVNKYASEAEQKAAWLFVVWATSPQAQLMDLKSAVGGGTPTRHSVYEMPQVKNNRDPLSSMPNIITASAVLKAWEPQNIGLRPKTPSWNQCDTVIYSQISQMLTGGKPPEDAMRDAKQEIDQATKGVPSAI
jgi:multiple sugar transport system substrate-binding protein